MERSRCGTLLGIGVIFLSHALARPIIAPLPALPAMSELPVLLALPPLNHAPFVHVGGWFRLLLLLGLIVLAIVWYRRGTCGATSE